MTLWAGEHQSLIARPDALSQMVLEDLDELGRNVNRPPAVGLRRLENGLAAGELYKLFGDVELAVEQVDP
jgi:hypothetical protein